MIEVCSQQKFYDFYMTLTDKQLSKRLDLCRHQIKLLPQSGHTEAHTNLFNMEAALIQARADKCD